MSQTVFTDGLGYEGKVTLTLKSNNKVLKSRTYKNKGTVQLFKFLGYCLIGAYEEAKTFLPNKILLLHNNSQSPVDANVAAVEQRSAWQMLAQTPTIISDSTNSQVRVLYSFEVPRAAISGSFNQVALYGAGVNVNDITDFSAYYFLVNGHNEWDAVELATWSTTTVLLIEWELTLSNKNTEINMQGGE